MKAKGWAGGIKSLVSLVNQVKRLLIRGKPLLVRPSCMCICMGVRPAGKHISAVHTIDAGPGIEHRLIGAPVSRVAAERNCLLV